MNLLVLFSLINGISAGVFGLFVYLKNRKSLVNKNFFLMSIGVAIWSFSYVRWLLMTTEESALFWSKMLNFGATLIPVFYLHWVLAFLNLDKKKRKIIFFGYVLTFIFLLVSFTSYYIKSVKPVLSFPYWPQAGPLYICFIILGYIGLVGYGLYQLFKERKTALKEKRNQIDYIILGTILGFGGGATNFPLMFGISLFPPFGQSLVSVHPFLWMFAILKYHLFEIRVILTEILVGVMGVILLVLPFLMETAQMKILTAGVFIFFCLFGYLLIKATHREIRRREEIERLYEELKVLDKAKSEFISMASHQLRTPLTAIKGYISMFLEGMFNHLSPKAREKMENVFYSNERLIKIVNDLLNISKVELGKMELEKEPTQIEDLIQSCYGELKIEAEKKGLKFSFQKSKKVLPKISIDSLKIRQVILNLIDNAIKYTQKGEIEIKAKKINSRIRVSVRDTGEGLTQEEKKKIFEGFTRGAAGFTYWIEGAGLGLYVAKKYIELHQGKIWAESKGKDTGSIFYVELPIK